VPTTVYALPTSEGVATLACRGDQGSSVAKACGAVAKTLAVGEGVRAYSPPPRDEFAKAVNPVFTRLAEDESTVGARLRRAKTPRSLATQLGGLERAYGRAAGALGAVEAAPFEREATTSIVQRLEGLEADHARLSDAARRRQRSRYRRLSDRIQTARADLRRRVEQLEPLGYELTSGGEQ
jgi:hypothetical protein